MVAASNTRFVRQFFERKNSSVSIWPQPGLSGKIEFLWSFGAELMSTALGAEKSEYGFLWATLCRFLGNSDAANVLI